jgi:large subunit ribosomal protein L24
MHVRKNDIVMVISGDDRGKKGRVLVASPREEKVVVEGVNYIWRHVRRSKKAPAGGRLQKEAPLPASKVAVFCPRCNRGVRTGHKISEKGDKIRICVRCREGV